MCARGRTNTSSFFTKAHLNNVVIFPKTQSSAARNHVAAPFLAKPTEHSHAVQFYESEDFLFDTVGQFLGEGLKVGDRMVVVATEAHRLGFVSRLEEFGVNAAIESGQLTFVDARQMLSTFMVGGMPDADLFHDALSRLLAKVHGNREPQARIRAYGEMVDILWREGNSRAAIRLEELWNDAGKAHSFSLLCAYVMGHFYNEGETARFMEVCRNHSHVLPTEHFTQLDDTGARLREISLLQQRACVLESELSHRKQLEQALRDALRERGRVENELRAAVKREQNARAKAEASDAFKEIFLGILGHDLRNPLNTVLTTARLMKMRRELPAEGQSRIDRIISSGVRMQRMIEQLIDVTRARHVTGITVALSDHEQDLLPVVKKVVDELRVAHALPEIELRSEETCCARIDGDRIEQVVSNLVGNAIDHGDRNRPVSVGLTPHDDVVKLSVHNWGNPIAASFIPLLFDPFKRSEKPHGRSDGLGLGLYISERIVSAHGGKLRVESSFETGTLFEAILPRNHE